MTHNRCELIRAVANSLVARDRDQAILAYIFKPLLIVAGRREQVVVPLDVQPCCGQYLREALAQISVCEIDKAQAARS